MLVTTYLNVNVFSEHSRHDFSPTSPASNVTSNNSNPTFLFLYLTSIEYPVGPMQDAMYMWEGKPVEE